MGLEVRANIKEVINVLPIDSVVLLRQGELWREENMIEKERVQVKVLLECYGQREERTMTMFKEEWEEMKERGWVWW